MTTVESLLRWKPDIIRGILFNVPKVSAVSLSLSSSDWFPLYCTDKFYCFDLLSIFRVYKKDMFLYYSILACILSNNFYIKWWNFIKLLTNIITLGAISCFSH